jgi:sulfur carrier protein
VTAEATVRVNGEERQLRAMSLADLLANLGYDASRPGLAAAVNDEIVPRGEWHCTAVHPGDRIEIVGAVAGG